MIITFLQGSRQIQDQKAEWSLPLKIESYAVLGWDDRYLS